MQAQLPAEVAGNERIQAQLAAALALIDASMEGAALPSYAAPPAATADAYAAAARAGPSFSRWGGGTVAQATAEPTLRQMVELYAEQNDLDFVPKAGRRHEGLQVAPSLLSSSECYRWMYGQLANGTGIPLGCGGGMWSKVCAV